MLELASKERHWISIARHCRLVASRARYAASLVVDVAGLEAAANAAHSAFVEASHRRHLLSLTLGQCVEECAALAEAARAGSMLPWPAGERDLEAASGRFAARPLDLSLASRRSRVILLKMLALSAFIGHRPIKKTRFRPKSRSQLPAEQGASVLATPGAAKAAMASSSGASAKALPLSADSKRLGASRRPVGRGRRFAEYEADTAALRLRGPLIEPDNVLGMAPDDLLHATAAALRAHETGVRARQAPQLRKVIESCRARIVQHIQASEARDMPSTAVAARRQRVAWYEAWERCQTALQTTPKLLR
jgi:hypothetical protein